MDVRKNSQLGQLPGLLLAWYDQAARPLPWRESTDPYRVWLSEIMLQQTRVEAVIPYFHRFVEQLPDIASLAQAPSQQLMKLWEGLGYYRRASNLQNAAKVIMTRHHGVFPSTHGELLALPGIGDYTAGAVASICFGLPTPAVDGNVLRVMARLCEDDGDIARPATKARVRALLGEIYPDARCGDFTQSLMELGATVCTPGMPRCSLCPVRDICLAQQNGTQAALPVKAVKAPRREEARTVLLLCCRGCVAVRRREEEGLLAGMWEFPSLPGCLPSREVEEWLSVLSLPHGEIRPGPHKKHIFTHLQWNLSSYRVECWEAHKDFVWVTPSQLQGELSLSSAFRAFYGLL